LFQRDELLSFQRNWLALDKRLFYLFSLLLVLGCLFSYSFSVSVATRIGVADYHFFRRHLAFALASLVLLLLLASLGPGAARRTSPLLFCISLLLLCLVPFFGFQTKGARRWLYIAGMSLQPSEFIKPLLILVFAQLLDRFSQSPSPRPLALAVVLYSLVMLLLFRQPDVGASLLITLVLSAQVLLTDFFRPRHFLYMLLVFLILCTATYLAFPHVAERLANFVLSVRDPERASYQVRRSLMAYRNAGWLGQGFLEGKIKENIPDIHTDFIFPAIAEEFGFSVALLLVLLYLYMALRVLLLANRKNSNYEFLAMNGLTLLMILQVYINICVSLNLLPTKGLTLPFLSYGGSSLLGTALASGYLLVFTKKEFGLVDPEDSRGSVHMPGVAGGKI
jgi:cell division protein FtsW